MFWKNPNKADLLTAYGADMVFIDDDTLPSKVKKFDKILELVGTKTLLSSFQFLAPCGILCMSGILGDAWELEKFAPMDSIPSGCYFTIFDSQIVNLKSLSAMQAFLQKHKITPPIAKVFPLSQIAEAHKLMESNTAGGKIIITTQ